ncbi:MAG: type II secretion system GspH family protein [Thiovulaceae bacterium]|nr:type II secretion system GspH family protein [Sulfurimonadaceae bacterium]
MVDGTYRTRVRSYARSAFTMIELIFAIVVIAVVMLTIPTMIQVNNKALEGSASQEAIFLVSAVLSETTTFLWDDNSLGGTASDVVLSKIVDTDGDDVYDRIDANSTIRIGNLREDLHRRLFDNVTAPDQTGTDTWTPIAGTAHNLVGYKYDYNVTATRSYIADAPSTFVFSTTPKASGTSNVKMTEVKVKAKIDGTDRVITRLRAYTCNIGETDYAKRRF